MNCRWCIYGLRAEQARGTATYAKMDGQGGRRHEPTVVARFGNGVLLVKEGEVILPEEPGLRHFGAHDWNELSG